MNTYQSHLITGLFTISIGAAGMTLPVAVLAVEGESQLLGQLTKIDGDRYTVQGEQGKNVTLRVTKDTNIICARGKGSHMSTGQESVKEQQEIPPTPFMDKQAKQGKGGSVVMPSVGQGEPGALSKDPSKMKDVVGSTDQKANEDVARGSGFAIGNKEDCGFKVGDRVKIEASDTDTATTIQQVSKAVH
ncbi:MAG: hypothetical protein LZF60_80190 [Nitrospira sp.]|nr:hypothetical protein [Nitrospira sp.]ULA58796.1 MAG: hypothetical protein LZF60_80190 [Nitrospira sp.]